ncbi:MAG: hypothetical protein RSF94_05915 [Rikenellaceae bacterium]
MIKPINYKGVIPHITAIAFFALVSMFFFLPQYEGRDVKQFDTVQANGMKASIYQHIEKYGEHPQWLANMFSGMPAYAVHMDYKGLIIPKIADNIFFLGRPAAYYFVLMLGFYFMLLCFRVNPWLSMVGGLAYGLSSYFLIIYGAGHIMKIVALCYIAPMIGALFLAYSRKLWLGASLFAIFATLEIAAVHPQIFYYFILTMIIMVVVFAIEAVREKRIVSFFKKSLVLLVFSLMAIGANSYYLYYTSEYTKESTRGDVILTSSSSPQNGLDKDYITAWSYGKMESFNMMIPNLNGGTSEGGLPKDGEVDKLLKERYNLSDNEREAMVAQIPAYFGPQPMTSGPVYIGAVIIFIFLFSLFIIKGVNLIWIVSATLLSLFLAWGHNMMWLTDLFIDYFPLYNKFRTVSMILVVVELTVPLLAMLGLNKVLNGEVDALHFKKAFRNSVIIALSITLFFAFFGGAIFSFVSDYDSSFGLPDDVLVAMSQDRAAMLRSDAVRSLIFVVLTAGTVLLFYKKRISKVLFIVVLSGLVLADMLPVDFRYLSHSKFVPIESANAIPMREVDKIIKQDTSLNYRVADFSVSTFSDARASVYHRSVGGYFAAKPRRYQDLIDRHLSKMNDRVYNMLNTKYFIISNGAGGELVQPNADALGNAWFVESVEVVNNPNAEIDMLNEIDPYDTAIVDKSFEKMLPSLFYPRDSMATIELTSYKDNRMVYHSTTTAPQLAVFSEMWFPNGWNAFIDGEKVDYLRANYVLEALVVPAGNHEIVFEFAPPHYKTLETITYISSILILLSLVLSLFGGLYKRKS